MHFFSMLYFRKNIFIHTSTKKINFFLMFIFFIQDLKYLIYMKPSSSQVHTMFSRTNQAQISSMKQTILREVAQKYIRLLCDQGLSKKYDFDLLFDLLLSLNDKKACAQVKTMARTKGNQDLKQFLKKKQVSEFLGFLKDMQRNIVKKNNFNLFSGSKSEKSELKKKQNQSLPNSLIKILKEQPLKTAEQILPQINFPLPVPDSSLEKQNKKQIVYYQKITQMTKFSNIQDEGEQIHQDFIEATEQKQLINSTSNMTFIELYIDVFGQKTTPGKRNHELKQDQNVLYRKVVQQAIENNPISSTFLLNYLVTLSGEKMSQFQDVKTTFELNNEDIDPSNPICLLKIFCILYTGDTIYGALNKKMREQQFIFAPSLIAHLIKGIRMLRSKSNTGLTLKQISLGKLYRGEESNEPWDEMEQGKQYSCYSFLSTSKDQQIARKFMFRKGLQYRRFLEIMLEQNNQNSIAFQWLGLENYVKFNEKEVLILPIFRYKPLEISQVTDPQLQMKYNKLVVQQISVVDKIKNRCQNSKQSKLKKKVLVKPKLLKYRSSNWKIRAKLHRFYKHMQKHLSKTLKEQVYIKDFKMEKNIKY